MRLGNKTTNPGELRTRVTFQSVTLVKDGSGTQQPTYATLDIVYVKWVNAHGPEAVSSDALKAVRRATVTRRYRSDVNESMCILKDGERWQIMSIDNIQARNEYQEIEVECAKGSA